MFHVIQFYFFFHFGNQDLSLNLIWAIDWWRGLNWDSHNSLGANLFLIKEKQQYSTWSFSRKIEMDWIGSRHVWTQLVEPCQEGKLIYPTKTGTVWKPARTFLRFENSCKEFVNQEQRPTLLYRTPSSPMTFALSVWTSHRVFSHGNEQQTLASLCPCCCLLLQKHRRLEG